MSDKQILEWFESLKHDEMGNVHVILDKEKVETIKASLAETKSIDINDISLGCFIKTRQGHKGQVFNIVKPIIDGVNQPSSEGKIISARLFIRYPNRSESYHTYRKDGISQQDVRFDIVKILEQQEYEAA